MLYEKIRKYMYKNNHDHFKNNNDNDNVNNIYNKLHYNDSIL